MMMINDDDEVNTCLQKGKLLAMDERNIGTYVRNATFAALGTNDV